MNEEKKRDLNQLYETFQSISPLIIDELYHQYKGNMDTIVEHLFELIDAHILYDTCSSSEIIVLTPSQFHSIDHQSKNSLDYSSNQKNSHSSDSNCFQL